MRSTALFLAVSAILLASSSAFAQSPAGRWEARSPQFYSVPQTAWLKAEILGDDAVSQQIGAAINAQLRLRGYAQTPGGAYALRLELRGRGLSTPHLPIPGYDNASVRLSIWPQADAPNAIYVSLLLYHQSTGQVMWQGEAVCVGLLPDARNIVNAMIGPLMNKFGANGKAALDCRNL